MASDSIMTENWLTQKPRHSIGFALFVSLLVLCVGAIDWFSVPLDLYLKASPENVFHQHQYYRLWTTLFVHADVSHLLSNMILFIPLIFLLASYYGSIMGPLTAIFLGGFINYFVLQTLPNEVFLIGISGVVNWLGATWLTLFFLIDLRENKRHRFAIVLFLTVILFMPSAYKPEISYLSHFIGYFLGILSGLIYYFIKRKKIKAAEVYQELIEEPLPQQ